MASDNPWSCLPAVPALELLAKENVCFDWHRKAGGGWLHYQDYDGTTTPENADRSMYMALCAELMRWLRDNAPAVAMHWVRGIGGHLVVYLTADQEQYEILTDDNDLVNLTAAVVAVCKETRDA